MADKKTKTKSSKKPQTKAKKDQDKQAAEKTHVSSESSIYRKKLYRSETDRVLGGVSTGLGEYFDLDPVLFRVLFLLMFFFGGSGLIIYLILWLILPSKSSLSLKGQDTIRQNAKEVKTKAEDMGQEIARFNRRNDSRTLWGLIIILLGAYFLLKNVGILRHIDFDYIWPLIIIFIGISIITKSD